MINRTCGYPELLWARILNKINKLAVEYVQSL